MGIGAAIATAGAVTAGASIIGSQTAAQAQKNAAEQANNLQQGEFNTYQQNLSPYVQSGNNALAQVNKLNTPGANQNAWLQQTPGYQFTLNQGLKSTQNAATARGLGNSGSALKGAASYATGLASGTFQNQYNNLFQQAGLGENAAAGVGNAALTTGQALANNTIGAGNAQAAANNASGAGIANAAGSGVGSLLTSQYLNALQGNNPGQYTSGASSGFGTGAGIFPKTV